jgi:hypothetical protein
MYQPLVIEQTPVRFYVLFHGGYSGPFASRESALSFLQDAARTCEHCAETLGR